MRKPHRTALKSLNCVFAVATIMGCTPEQPAVDLAIVNVRVVDGLGGSEERAAVTIQGGRIRTIDTSETPTQAAQTIDGTGMTVLPGLFDTHLHLNAFTGIRDRDQLDRWVQSGVGATLETALNLGITTILDPGAYFPAITEVAAAVENGSFPGPRVLFVGPVFTTTGGHPASTVCAGNDFCASRVAAQVDTAEAARTSVRDVASGNATAIKLVYGPNPRQLPVMTDDVLTAICSEADEYGLPVYGHVPVSAAAAKAMALGLDGLVHTPWIGTIENPGSMANVPVASTVAIFRPVEGPDGQILNPFGRPLNDEFRRQILENARVIYDAGAVYAFGTDNPPTLDYPTAVRSEIKMLSEVFSPMEVIRIMTSHAARYLGVQADLGSIESGKIADLVLVQGNPLESTDALGEVALVIQNGQITIDHRGAKK